MPSYKRLHASIAAIALAASGLAQATAVDAAGDFLATYSGPKNGDMDVLSTSAVYFPSAHMWQLQATLAGPIGTTPGAFYVFGVNRGNGTAAFNNVNGPNNGLGLDGVLFDTVAAIRPGGNSTVAGNAIPGSGITIVGNQLTVQFADTLLPSLNLFTPDQYTWNLWPRTPIGTPSAPSPVGTAAQISDFAPDNSNFATLIPEPAGGALLALGLAGLAVTSRRRRG